MADRIELRIDHLVLDGVAQPHQVTEITEAVHAELTRLLTATPAGRWARRGVAGWLAGPSSRDGPANSPPPSPSPCTRPCAGGAE